jgi:hypothetical protein
MLFGNTHLQDLEAYKLRTNPCDGQEEEEGEGESGFFPKPLTRIFSKEELLAFRATLPCVPRQ